MYEHALPRVLKAYSIEYETIYDSQKGYRNEIWPVKTTNGQMLNVTFFKREPGITERIKRADKVSEYLLACGLPTRRRHDKRILTLSNSASTTYVGVYDYLPGQTIPWEAYTMKHIKQLGATMSDMHSELMAMSVVDFPSVYDEYLQIAERMNQYFSQSEVAGAVKNKLGLNVYQSRFVTYHELLLRLRSRPSQQVLHMDFVRGNILFEGTKISGILDFEKTAVGHNVVDIARTLAFLLVDCKYKTAEKVEKYFLYSGYEKRGTTKEIGEAIDRNLLVEMFLVYDFYKFLRHNPYESLAENEHYQRTKDILVKRGVIFYL